MNEREKGFAILYSPRFTQEILSKEGVPGVLEHWEEVTGKKLQANIADGVLHISVYVQSR